MATKQPAVATPRAILEDRYDGLMYGRHDTNERRPNESVLDSSRLAIRLTFALRDLVAGMRREAIADSDLVVDRIEDQLRAIVVDEIEASR